MWRGRAGRSEGIYVSSCSGPRRIHHACKFGWLVERGDCVRSGWDVCNMQHVHVFTEEDIMCPRGLSKMRRT